MSNLKNFSLSVTLNSQLSTLNYFMKAMVMCAGLGTRLRPLTYLLPKPMVPVANKPVLEHTLENLKQHGIREVVINLSYHPHITQSYFKDGSKWNLKINYSIEKNLLGTAGGVKNVEKIFLDDPDPNFLVTSGDGLTDLNFSNLIAFHRKKRAFGTIALKKMESRFEYGVALLNADGKIKKFVEKPSWGDVFSSLVNTGIYVFNKEIFRHIPPKQFYDFGRELLPKLLEQKKAIYGFEFNEFWTDIGNMTEYRQAQRAALEKKVSVKMNGREIRPKIWVDEGAKLSPRVQLSAPCMIGKYCNIGENATIGSHTILGHQSKIGSRALIKNSILWDGVHVSNKVHLDNCIIGSDAKVKESISVFEGTILKVDA